MLGFANREVRPRIARMSNSVTALVDRVQTLLADGRTDDAIAILESEASRYAESFEVWNCLGQAYGLAGRHGEAERAYRHALRLRPDLHEAHYNLALSLAYQDKLRDSIGHFLNARRINPHNPDFQKTLFPILVTLLQGDDESARAPARRFPQLNERPLVSVIMPTQNRPRMLQDALKSVCRQSYQNWEVIVVNDGGAEVSPVLKSMPSEMEAKTRLIGLRTAHGPAAARNAAIKVAKGDILAFLDDDDLFSPGHLEGLVSGLRASNAGMAYSAAELVEEEILDGTRVEVGRKPLFPGLRYSRQLLLVRNFIPINTWGVRRECFGAIGAFDEALHYLEDWDFLLRLSLHAEVHQMKNVSAEYRVTRLANDSVTKRHPHLQAVKSLYRRFEVHGHELVTVARELYLETLA